MVLIQVSPGNSGCCDCGDKEAWKIEVNCSIHTVGFGHGDADAEHGGHGKQSDTSAGETLPNDLVEAMRATLSRCIDYLCDVFSCSPEQMRHEKSEDSIKKDEHDARLSPAIYGEEQIEEQPEYALILWNDEKHTMDEVMDQVAKACKVTRKAGLMKATEVDGVGRSIIHYSRDIKALLEMAAVIEQIKVTVTIRSSRDTFREQMCATIIDWIADIAGCAIGNEPYLLRTLICEELLRPWKTGSNATYKFVGEAGLFDHEDEERARRRKQAEELNALLRQQGGLIQLGGLQGQMIAVGNDNDEEIEVIEDQEEEMAGLDEVDVEDILAAIPMDVDEDGQQVPIMMPTDGTDMEIDIDFVDGDDEALQPDVANFAAAPPPPPPPPIQAAPEEPRRRGPRIRSDRAADAQVPRPPVNAPFPGIPSTPHTRVAPSTLPSPHWLERPDGFRQTQSKEPYEDIWQRVRLDFLVLYDLRMWKNLRIDLRHLYITTVVTIPKFKAVLGIRFAGLYTALAQLYLIADREPDHSIINLSLQILTTPTITADVVERGNFLTNLMAILYTFLTTRQVGFPEHVNPKATLAIEAGVITNRRMFHFLADLRFMFQSDFIHRKLREEQRYLLQFLDLVKLHQGACPNVRAVDEHVEYESETWINTSAIVQHMNKLCKQVAASFEPGRYGDASISDLQRAIQTVAQVTLINACGCERTRFVNAEPKHDLTWHTIGPFPRADHVYKVPKYVVQSEPMSFHHPLHYLLSWLIEDAKNLSRGDMRALLQSLVDPWHLTQVSSGPVSLSFDELLGAIFDPPLRVCVWLAQMKTSMWVRNGITLRHQAHQYRSVGQRDVGFQRDIIMLQTGLVLCGSKGERIGERFLAQIIDRFQMTKWFKEDFSLVPGFEEQQQLDVVEDLLHLLVIALSERGNLLTGIDERTQHDRILQHDIAHALCFKPLSFSDLGSRVTEKVSDSDDFNRVLESMTKYRAPEGLSDTGTFELMSNYIELVDPYYAHYTRNQREEAETICKKHMSQKTGQKVEDVVYEPKLARIETGMFSHLSAFTRTPLFCQVIAAAVTFARDSVQGTGKLPSTRVETFLHTTLHLLLVALQEDRDEPDGSLAHFSTLDRPGAPSLMKLLLDLNTSDHFSSCQPAILHALRKMQVGPSSDPALASLAASLDRPHTSSPSTQSDEDKEKKRLAAKARQARIMAQMKQQQESFLQHQGLAGFEEESDHDDDMKEASTADAADERRTWSFPSGTCILCQEETDDRRLYGVFEHIGQSSILRSTPFHDPDFVREVIETPASLDRSAESTRPFGVSGQNRKEVRKISSDGTISVSERQDLSKGFPHRFTSPGPVGTSCGHIMHFQCFELYIAATARRHQQQISRNHPERPEEPYEFVCPLCKALGNMFLPITWRSKECAHEHELHAAQDFGDWLTGSVDGSADDSVEHQGSDSKFHDFRDSLGSRVGRDERTDDSYKSWHYLGSMFSSSLFASMQALNIEADSALRAQPFGRAALAWSRLFGIDPIPSLTPTSAAGSEMATDQSRAKELWRAYERMNKNIAHVVDKNRGLSTIQPNAIPSLCRTFGMSISALEISNRGAGGAQLSECMIPDLSEQTLVHLRILSETIESFLAMHTLRPGPTPVVAETDDLRTRMHARIFGLEAGERRTMEDVPLFTEDIFLFMVQWISIKAPSVAEASLMLQLCYWAEIVKTIFVCKEIVKRTSMTDPLFASLRGGISKNRENFRLALVGMDFEDRRFNDIPWTDDQVNMLYHLVEKYALPFLRKSLIMMYIRYGLEFKCPYDIDPEASELYRLTKLLHIATIDDLCGIYTSSAARERLQNITSTWLSQAQSVRSRDGDDAPSYTLAHPAILELVGLPKNYDTLTEEVARRKCPTTGKDISDPAVCLMCGEIFCSQAVCCSVRRNVNGKMCKVGGVYQHLEKHGEKVGIFINIRKCYVLFAHGPGQGGFHQAPYLDKHGEPDPTLRRHHQLYLNQRRYDKLFREVWLNHQIPTIIARKLEADHNYGGWETL
jgi:E3 ubiquitin-protein ligase UBR1